ncbi:hypothetical protein Aduo_005054 [Ancylostoma duodenale]
MSSGKMTANTMPSLVPPYTRDSRDGQSAGTAPDDGRRGAQNWLKWPEMPTKNNHGEYGGGEIDISAEPPARNDVECRKHSTDGENSCSGSAPSKP